MKTAHRYTPAFTAMRRTAFIVLASAFTSLSFETVQAQDTPSQSPDERHTLEPKDLIPKGLSPMSGAEFSSFAQGRMLTFSDNGTPYGAEQYLPNNRVRWAFDEDTCLEGVWYEQEEQICFIYEDESAPQCWLFFQDNDKLHAIFGDGSSGSSYEAHASDGPLSCMAPGLGV